MIAASSPLWWRTIIEWCASKAPFFFFDYHNDGGPQSSFVRGKKTLSSSLLLPTCLGHIVPLSPNNSATAIVLFNPFWSQLDGGLWPVPAHLAGVAWQWSFLCRLSSSWLQYFSSFSCCSRCAAPVCVRACRLHMSCASSKKRHEFKLSNIECGPFLCNGNYKSWFFKV